ncbi:MAG: hypothetical protein DWQ10_18715 [Calditrichaeota bacterium]|nr:MAG: hypothetical protein DWQ10_18715 [Calditrichota bacterium]
MSYLKNPAIIPTKANTYFKKNKFTKEKTCADILRWLMRTPPTQEQLRFIPGLYQTENTPAQNKIIHLHFFIPASLLPCPNLPIQAFVRNIELRIVPRPYHWYVAEYDPELDSFFGFVHSGNWEEGIWETFGLEELQTFQLGKTKVHRDKEWEPTVFSKIPKED